MVLSGSWKLCDDGVLRPAFLAEVQAADGSWVEAWFLADTGGDRTVFCEDLLRELGLQSVGDAPRLEGVGGAAACVVVDTVVQVPREDGTPVRFKGRFAAFTNPATLDISVLGREITNLFALIVDRPGDVVCLVAGAHRYQIIPEPPRTAS